MTTPHQGAPDGAITVGGGKWRYGQTVNEKTARSAFEFESPTTLAEALEILPAVLELLPNDSMKPWQKFFGHTDEERANGTTRQRFIDTLASKPTPTWITNIITNINNATNGGGSVGSGSETTVFTNIKAIFDNLKEAADTLQGITAPGNVVISPNFELNSIKRFPFGTPTVVYSAEQKAIGNQSLRVTTTSASQGVYLAPDQKTTIISVQPGDMFNVGVKVRAHASNNTTGNVTLFMRWLNNGATISDVTGTTVLNSLAGFKTGFLDFEAAATAPALADGLQVWLTTDATTPVGQIYYVDAAYVREKTQAQLVIDKIHEAIDGASALQQQRAATVKDKLQKAWAEMWDGLSGTTGTAAKLPSEVRTAAAGVRTTANTASTTAGTATTNIQTTIDNIHQAIQGGTATGNGLATVKTNLQNAWSEFWDGLSGTSGSSGKIPSEVRTAAGGVRTTANTASTNASAAITNAATADGKAVTAQTNIQTTIDNIHQAIAGGTATGNGLATVKSNLQNAWSNFWDGLSGTTGSTGKLPSEVQTAAAGVRTTANTANTTAGTANTNASNAVTTANNASTTAGTAQTTANTATTNLQTTWDNIHQAINGGVATGNGIATVKTNLQNAWSNFWDGLNGTTGSAGKLPTDVQTAAAGVRTTANTANTTAGTANTNANTAITTANNASTTAGTANTNANTANTNLQATVDNISQAVNGGTATGNALATVKANLALAWAQIWDGHNGTTGTTVKTPLDVRTVAAGVRTTSNTASTNASTAITNAATADAKAVTADGKAVTADGKAVTADGKAVTAQTNIQTTVDNIHQAIAGGTATGNGLATVKSNLQAAWANIWDGLSGSTGTASKLPSEVLSAAASVRTTANTANTTAGTALTNAATADAKAVTADGKAVTADGKAVTADGKAVAAQGTANTATTNLQSTVDNIHQAVQGGAATGNGFATVKSNLQNAWARIYDGLNGTTGTSVALPSDAQTAGANVRSSASAASTAASSANTNLGTLNDNVTNAFLGESLTATTLSQAFSAMQKTYGDLQSARNDINALKAEKNSTSAQGVQFNVDFNNFSTMAAAGFGTITYSGPGTSTIGISGGVAQWVGTNNADRDARLIYDTATNTDFQVLRGTMTGPPQNGGSSGRPRFHAICRVADDGTDYVFARAYSDAFLSYKAELGCVVNGVETIWVNNIPLTWSLDMSVVCGVGTNSRQYQVYSGNTLATAYTENLVNVGGTNGAPAAGNFLSIQGNTWKVSRGTATSGTFTLTYNGTTTTAIAFNATAETVRAALTALGHGAWTAAGIGTTSSAGGPWFMQPPNTQAATLALTGNGASLVGGTLSLTQDYHRRWGAVAQIRGGTGGPFVAGKVSGTSVADNEPPAVKGTGAMMTRTGTGTVTFTGGSNDTALPNNFFSNIPYESIDCDANTTDGTFTVTKAGMYVIVGQVRISANYAALAQVQLQRFTGGSWSTVQKGMRFQPGTGGAGQTMGGCWTQYLAAGDKVRLSTWGAGINVSILTGESSGTETYFSIAGAGQVTS